MSFRVAVGMMMLASGVVASAQTGTGGTITDGDVIFTQGRSPSGNAGLTGIGPPADMKTVGAMGPDHIHQNWWWYRVEGADAREFALGNASSANWSGNTGVVSFTFPSFTAVLTYVVTDTGTNSGRLMTSLAVTNTTGDPLTLQLFNYQDFDIQASVDDDSAVLAVSDTVLVTDPSGQVAARYTGAGSTAYQVSLFGALRTLLTNTEADDFNNTGLPFGPGDFTGAFQWTLDLSSNQTQTVAAEINIQPPPSPGRCCLPDTICAVMTAAECEQVSGVYGGDRSLCEFQFDQSCSGAFENIAPTGFSGPACDDCGMTVPLGFAFHFFGSSFTEVGIASNGYLTFGSILDAWSNQPIPSPGAPNNLIAGYWDDLNSHPFTGGGTIRFQTVGDPGSRRFIAQWTAVPHFDSFTDRHTFQIVLFEGSNNIEVRYSLLPPLSSTITPSIGIENAGGSAGIGVDPAAVNAPTCIAFDSTPEPCAGIACPCDWNDLDSVNSQDFFDFLTDFFAGNADFNDDSMTNSQDFFDFLTCFFEPPNACE